MAAFIWSLMSLCLGHSALLGQYQNCMVFLLLLLRNDLTLVASGMMMF